MKRTMPGIEPIDVISSDESSSLDGDTKINDGADARQLSLDSALGQPIKEMTFEGGVIRRAEMYQEYMRQLPIPARRGSLIPFSSWVGLGQSIKQLYGQPLHYLTNILLRQWDHLRMGSEDEQKPLDIVIHPSKAEATIWLVEEVHRRTSSPHHVAKLWLLDPKYRRFIDSIFPQL